MFSLLIRPFPPLFFSSRKFGGISMNEAKTDSQKDWLKEIAKKMKALLVFSYFF
jgi:hypothetical protein